MSIPSLPAFTTSSASDSARVCVRSVLERNAGDDSRFLPRNVGARKDASRLTVLHAARHALATQRGAVLHYILLEGWCNHVASCAYDLVTLCCAGASTQPNKTVFASV